MFKLLRGIRLPLVINKVEYVLRRSRIMRSIEQVVKTYAHHVEDDKAIAVSLL